MPGDLPHDRAAALNCMNGGAMDGFGGGKYGAVYGYSQFHEAQIPNYYQWARDYAISDNFHASALGPSFPNHFYFIAGQSGGVIDNPENILSNTDEKAKKIYKSWGCDAIGDDVYVLVKDPLGNLTKHDTCFDYQTVGQQLTGPASTGRTTPPIGGSPATSGTPTTASTTSSTTRPTGTPTSAPWMRW